MLRPSKTSPQLASAIECSGRRDLVLAEMMMRNDGNVKVSGQSETGEHVDGRLTVISSRLAAFSPLSRSVRGQRVEQQLLPFACTATMTPRAALRSFSVPTKRVCSCLPYRAVSTSAAALPPTIASSLANAAKTDKGAPTTLNGWIRSVRRQKNVSFAVLSDASTVGGVQVVLPKGLDERQVLPLAPFSHVSPPH